MSGALVGKRLLGNLVSPGKYYAINQFLVNVPILHPLKTPKIGGIKWEHWSEMVQQNAAAGAAFSSITEKLKYDMTSS